MVYLVEDNNIFIKELKPTMEEMLYDEHDELVVQRQINRKKQSVRVRKLTEEEAHKRCDLHTLDFVSMDSRREPVNKNTNRYNIFTIPKKDGGKRTIEEPDGVIQGFQKANLKRMIKMSGAHAVRSSNAFAFAKDRSTLESLKRHQYNKSRWFLKLDIHHFFESTTREVITNQLKKIWPYSHFVEQYGTRFQTRMNFFLFDERLPQGAPSSPALSNMVMIPFDYEFAVWCREKGYVFTRYADDMLISARESFNWREVVAKVEELFRVLGYGYELNKKKTRYGSRAGRNWNLGLMLNKDNEITVGWRQKKEFKAALESIAHGNDEILAEKAGLLSYYKMVEPDYFNYLIDKYSAKFGVDLKQKLG